MISKQQYDGLRQHAKEYNIDTSKIAVLGFSAGGELAAFMGSTNEYSKIRMETAIAILLIILMLML